MRLAREFYRSRGGEGQGNIRCEPRGEAYSVKRGDFRFERFSVVKRIYIGRALLKITVDFFAQLAVAPKRGFVGAPVLQRPRRAVRSCGRVVYQTVLRGYFGGGVLCDSAAERATLRKYYLCARRGERYGSEQPCHAAADNEYVRRDIAAEGGMAGYAAVCGSVLPY